MKMKIQSLAAGLPRSGKSRGMSHIFDVPFEYGCSASPVTSEPKSVMTTIHENTLKIIDVPGLGDQEIHTKVVEKQIKRAVTGNMSSCHTYFIFHHDSSLYLLFSCSLLCRKYLTS